MVAGLVIFGAAALVIAALVGGNGTPPSETEASIAVDRLIPAPGDEVLQQQRVGVVLNPRYRLTSLVIYPNDRYTGGVNVSAQVQEVEGLNLFEYAPGEGRLVESLSADTNCARATYVLISRPEDSDNINWCFEVA